ncbi:CHAT domain-containing protein [Romeria aff. gracilis LEGE 07310]|uniref:CHAT domain-containing protein n=2 Tax=Vasconcelosia TaxID=3366328 RepID=A0A8J7B0E4_9CYAN|nr:CHAT domain-containing protein [Romeria aff. gracilis LEGE 07310]
MNWASGSGTNYRRDYRLIALDTASGQITPTLSESASEQTANRLSLQGSQQYRSGQYHEALRSWETALALFRELGDNAGVASTLGSIGNVYVSLGDYEEALNYYNQSLSIIHEIGNRAAEATLLYSMGNAHRALKQYEDAIDLHQQALAIEREIGNRAGESDVLLALGWSYSFRAQYYLAINFFYKAMQVAQEIGNPSRKTSALYALGWIHDDLGQRQKAIGYYQEALFIARENENQYQEAFILNGLAWVHSALGEYHRSIDFFYEQLAISQEISNRRQEANALNGLGFVHTKLSQYRQAIQFSEQALFIHREVNDLREEAYALGDLGNTYASLGEYQKAIDYLMDCLLIQRKIGNRWGEGITLSSIAKVLSAQRQTELAIVFLKASVEVREAIRSDIRGLNSELQRSFVGTIADDYRLLSDLLLEQGRIPEAQQVLELLKIEELREFSNNTRAAWTSDGIAYTTLEQPVADVHGDLIAFGQTLYECEQTNCDQLNGLLEQHEQLTAQYDQQVTAFQSTVRDNRYDDSLFQNPDNLSGDAQKLLEANPDSVLIYPFVTDDKLWLLYATVGSVGSIEIEVSQGDLSKTVQRFGELLQSGDHLAELQATSQQLHQWLIEPLEGALQQNGVDHLIFVNDRVTRYIPMAALFDGQSYLIERYTVSTVLSPALTDTTESLETADTANVLGLGLTQAVTGFDPLPAVEQELDSIVRSGGADTTGVYPGQVYLNEAFTLDQFKSSVADYRVLHVATHAAFVPGQPEASYIVLGNGDRMQITDIETMERRLRNLHLVVLSACQTALGGEGGDGTEIAGISAYFLEAGRAETVIASLWSVSDDSTSLLMQRFYELLASGELTKAEALRQAQLSLLYDQDTEARLTAARNASLTVQTLDGQPRSEATDLAHPYHWAPFILIGNGL